MNSEQPLSTPPETPSVAAAPLPRPRARRVRAGLIAAIVAVAGALFWFSQRSSPAAVAAAEAPDAPRVQGGLITFSAAFAERAGLRTSTAVSSRLVPVVNTVGTVDFDPAYVAAVGARLKGLVSRVAKFEGDSVDSGTVLATIESAELGEAEAAVSMLEAEKGAADVNFARESQLLEKSLSTAREAEVAAVEAQKYELLLRAARQKVTALAGGPGSGARGRLGSHELRSPLKGTIVERSIAPGQSVDGELVAFRVANVEHLWVALDVFERHLSKIRVGDRVELTPLSSANQVFEGRVARVAPRIDPETRSAPIRIEVDNRDRRLRAGQAVNASIHASGDDDHASTLVPSSAVTYVDGKSTVFIVSRPGAVRVAKVELGASNGSDVEVLSGIAPGEQLVSEGVFALKSELFR